MRRSVLLSLAIFLTAGCGAGAAEPTANEVAALQELTTSVQTAVDRHSTMMMDPSTPPTTSCSVARDNYMAEVRPLIAQMMDGAAGMDGFMMAHGGRTSVDMRCAAAMMMADLDRHQSAACGSGDAADRTEAVRHMGMMNATTSHMLDRCREMMAAMRGEPMNPGPMMDGCAGWTETASRCCGGNVSCGGMMGR